MKNILCIKLFTNFFKVASIMGILIAATPVYGSTHNQSVDLIQDDSWLYFPGAQMVRSSIHFQPLHRIIVHQDGSLGQPNPPVNLGSRYLLVSGNFKIVATVSQIDKQASLRLYMQPPIIYDQWRHEPPSIDIALDAEKNTVTARIWDGSSSHSMDIRTYDTSFTPQTTISLEHAKDQVLISKDGQMLGSMPSHDIFDSGTIWFGADGAPESKGWTLSSLIALPVGIGSVTMMPSPLLVAGQDDENSLRNASDAHPREITIGAAVSLGPLLTDEHYRKLALSEFSIMTPENAMKPQFIHPEPNAYDFVEADQLVKAALENNISVHGHTLVYQKSSPDWMSKSKVTDRQHIMTDHINAVVNHFRGKVVSWDVVNEPFSQKNALYQNGGAGLDENIWFEAMGEKYIDLAFRAAREADPDAKLYLNDFGLERDGQRWDALLGLAKRLKERGVPIDGVGFETHIYGDGDYINPSQLQEHMEILAGLGLSTRISEIDVTQDDEKEQVNQYVAALDVCLRASDCTSYTTWGISDRYGSTTRSDRYPLVHGTSLLWDKDMNTKPAYRALQERLQLPY